MLKRLFLALVLFGSVPAFAEDATSPYLYDLLKTARYLNAWNGMLASESVPAWVKNYAKNFNGPATPSKDVAVGGEPYTLAWVCKAHDCDNYQLYVLFAPGARQAWGLMISGGDKRSWLSRPDTAIQAAILSGVN